METSQQLKFCNLRDYQQLHLFSLQNITEESTKDDTEWAGKSKWALDRERQHCGGRSHFRSSWCLGLCAVCWKRRLWVRTAHTHRIRSCSSKRCPGDLCAQWGPGHPGRCTGHLETWVGLHVCPEAWFIPGFMLQNAGLRTQSVSNFTPLTRLMSSSTWISQVFSKERYVKVTSSDCEALATAPSPPFSHTHGLREGTWTYTNSCVYLVCIFSCTFYSTRGLHLHGNPSTSFQSPPHDKIPL